MVDQEVTGHEINANLAIIGDAACGKSSLYLRYNLNNFQNIYMPTFIRFSDINIDFKGKTINLRIWDTAGEKSSRNTIRSYFYRWQGYMIVFDLTKRSSFNSLSNWINEIYKLEKPFIIIGAKSDLSSQRQVTYDEAKEFADNINSCYLEVSNANCHNVENAFRLIIREMMSKLS